jgi:radical SAM superfamily enzyme YgiQ (UPF0313 family)
MSDTSVILTLGKNHAIAKVEGTRVAFSPHQCFAFDNGAADIECLRSLAGHLKDMPGLIVLGSARFIEYFIRHVPDMASSLIGTVQYENSGNYVNGHGLASVVIDMGVLHPETQTVFLCETLTFPRMQIKKHLPSSVKVLEPTVLAEIAPEVIPARGWTPLPRNIYPIDIPEIKFQSDLDLAIVDAPSRNLSLMPNGLAYLNNALKKTSVSFQILDLDIISYHRFHVHRLYDMGGSIVLPGDLVLPEDPWQAEHYDLWTAAGGGASGETGRNEVLEFFRPLIDETIEALAQARPKVLGLSIQGCNEAAAREVAVGVKARLPDIVIVVGGFSCYNADIGRRAFPECDYMCIGEADLTVGPLFEALAQGKRPFNQPGVLSRFDTPEYKYIPAPMIHDLDQIEFPKYEWCDLKVYRNFNDYQLTPIIASRGCRWSRCTFCAERFYWRIRTPENFVDELEWLVNQGCHLFMFNESDLGGMPERVVEICDEIIRRGLHRKVKLTGQLRVNKNQTRMFFERLREANFVALRFGIDAFSENTLRLQKKGYTVEMIEQNLRDCWEVGIFTEVNWVIGVPGETEQDVAEGIDLILRNSKYIGRLANINPLILVNGSVYWIDPEAHNIVFKEPKDQIYAKYPRAMPADQWHSTNPYIDAQVRKARFERIVISLHDAGFQVGAWANRIIEDVKLSRDKARTGGGENDSGSFGEFTIAGGAIELHTDALTEEAQAVEVASHRTPLEEKSHTGKVIPIRATEAKDYDATKPAATPPLFGVAGEAPRLVRKTESHNVIFHNGWYFGVPPALADVDLAAPETAKLSGIIRFSSEEDVIAAIEESAQWANSRGQYDDQKKQRAAGSYMRADSVGEMALKAELPPKPRILRFGGSFIAVDQTALADAFTSRRFGNGSGSKSGETAAESARPIPGGTVVRRMVGRLPPSVVERVRGLIRQQSYSSGMATGLLVTKSDGQLAGMLARALGDAYIKRPLARLRNAVMGRNATQALTNGVKVEGEDFSIVSVVTKNAQPELMWTIGAFNIVKFDGMYYGVPHGTSVDWESGALAAIPGMLVGANVADVVSAIDSRSNASVPDNVSAGPSMPVAIEQVISKDPVLLWTMESEGYNIVSYEGWVYGMPHDLGPIDLTQVDVIEMPGVIRDVSRDAVESEVISRSKENRQVA